MSQVTWLSTESIAEVTELLSARSLLQAGESVGRLETAGAGNMNVTLRVIMHSAECAPAERSLIVKQSRPFVAKYDSIPAPLERVAYEAAFYHFVEQWPMLSRVMPRLVAWVPAQHLLIIEDLGPASDATYLYQAEPQTSLPSFIAELLEWLHTLHDLSRSKLDSECFRNRKLRELNHAHIFEIPFQDPPAIDLDGVCSGLAKATSGLRGNTDLRERATALGQLYLADGDCLLHGDFYPGSWLITSTGPKVIDPEFCFAGKAEFDVAIVFGHLKLMGYSHAENLLSDSVAERQQSLDFSLIRQFAAVEVLRRLLGVAQLPLKADLERRLQLIDQAAAELLDAN